MSSYAVWKHPALFTWGWKKMRSKNLDGEGNGNPLQYSCLENPTDRGAWWATVHRVTENWIWLNMLAIGDIFIFHNRGRATGIWHMRLRMLLSFLDAQDRSLWQSIIQLKMPIMLNWETSPYTLPWWRSCCMRSLETIWLPFQLSKSRFREDEWLLQSHTAELRLLSWLH